jgi:hypothetical protein
MNRGRYTVSRGFHSPHNPSHAPTPDQRSDAKLLLRRLPDFAEVRRSDLAVGWTLRGSQQHHAAIGGKSSAVEGGDDFLASDGWKAERLNRIVEHGGCGSA